MSDEIVRKSYLAKFGKECKRIFRKLFGKPNAQTVVFVSSPANDIVNGFLFEAQMLMEEGASNVKIIAHTDSAGQWNAKCLVDGDLPEDVRIYKDPDTQEVYVSLNYIDWVTKSFSDIEIVVEVDGTEMTLGKNTCARCAAYREEFDSFNWHDVEMLTDEVIIGEGGSVNLGTLKVINKEGTTVTLDLSKTNLIDSIDTAGKVDKTLTTNIPETTYFSSSTSTVSFNDNETALTQTLSIEPKNIAGLDDQNFYNCVKVDKKGRVVEVQNVDATVSQALDQNVTYKITGDDVDPAVGTFTVDFSDSTQHDKTATLPLKLKTQSAFTPNTFYTKVKMNARGIVIGAENGTTTANPYIDTTLVMSDYFDKDYTDSSVQALLQKAYKQSINTNGDTFVRINYQSPSDTRETFAIIYKKGNTETEEYGLKILNNVNAPIDNFSTVENATSYINHSMSINNPTDSEKPWGQLVLINNHTYVVVPEVGTETGLSKCRLVNLFDIYKAVYQSIP